MLSKEILNQNRVLTMSNNRNSEYLIIGTTLGKSKDKNSIISMVITDNNISKDIIFVKEINYIEEILDIYKEFDIYKKIVIDINGYGSYLYDNIQKYIKPYKLYAEKNVYKNKAEIMSWMIDDIQLGQLRFLQSVNCAKVGYRKSFLGYSEMMNSHRETDKLINEIDNVEIKQCMDGNIKFDFKNRDIMHLRFNCLVLFYSMLLNKKSEVD